MTASQLMNINFSGISKGDSVAKTLEIADKYHCSHLPYIDKAHYMGLASRSELDEMSLEDTLDFAADDLLPCSVNESVHLVSVAAVSTLYKTNVIPVVNEAEEYQGCVLGQDLIDALGQFCGAEEWGSIIVLQIEKSRIILSELNSIVESDGATLLHYNMIPIAGSSFWEVTLGVDKRDIATIIANLEQYQYKILYSSGEHQSETDLSSNYQNLMYYLDI